MKKILLLTTLLLVLFSCKEPKEIKRGATQEFPHCPVFLQMINVDLFRKEITNIFKTDELKFNSLKEKGYPVITI